MCQKIQDVIFSVNARSDEAAYDNMHETLKMAVDEYNTYAEDGFVVSLHAEVHTTDNSVHRRFLIASVPTKM